MAGVNKKMAVMPYRSPIGGLDTLDPTAKRWVKEGKGLHKEVAKRARRSRRTQEQGLPKGVTLKQYIATGGSAGLIKINKRRQK